MSVSSVETQNGAIATSGSATVTIATSLLPADRLVVSLIKANTSGTPSVTGLGTWSSLQAGTSLFDHYLFTANGITGGGNITISVGSTAGDYAAYVLRSSVGNTVTTHGSGKIDSTVSANTAVTVADITGALTGMFVCGAAVTSAGTLTFPHANTLPASGWTTDRTGSNGTSKFISQQLASDTTARIAASASALANLAVLAGVFADGTGPTPLTSSFVGWGTPIF